MGQLSEWKLGYDMEDDVTVLLVIESSLRVDLTELIIPCLIKGKQTIKK
jgi:hypothetical protein